MGKIISWIIPIIIAVLAIVIWFIPQKKVEENQTKEVFVQNRKDTISEFGNARFVILRAYDKNKKETRWRLYDNINRTIEFNVRNFIEIAPYVYTVGEIYEEKIIRYTKLNYETSEVKQSEDISEFSKEDQAIFKKLEEEKDNVEIK